MPRIPVYGDPKVPIADAPDVTQSFDLSPDMFGGNQARAMGAWGDAVKNMGSAADTFSSSYADDDAPTKERSPFPDSPAKSPPIEPPKFTTPSEAGAEPAFDPLSPSQRGVVDSINGGFRNPKATASQEGFRSWLDGAEGTMRAYPELTPHIDPAAVRARDVFWNAFETGEADWRKRNNVPATTASQRDIFRAQAGDAAIADHRGRTRGLGGFTAPFRPVAQSATPSFARTTAPGAGPLPDREKISGSSVSGTLYGDAGGDTLAGPAKQAPPQPVKAFVTVKTVDELLKEAGDAGGYLAGTADKKSQHCVPFVKYAVPELGKITTGDWIEGQKIRGPNDPPLQRGTAIATFTNGKYGNNSTGNHAAIFLEYGTSDGKNGFWVLDQFKPHPNNQDTGTVRRRFYAFKPTSKNFTSNAANYSVINKK